ncbi:MAG: hypothetical protein ACRCX4_01460 [Bacteroidales bacterium]
MEILYIAAGVLLFIWLLGIAEMLLSGYRKKKTYFFSKVIIFSVPVMGLIVLAGTISFFFIDRTVSKNEMREYLKKHEIVLQDDFRVLNVMEGGYYQGYYFEVSAEVSARDKQVIIDKIRLSSDFDRDGEDTQRLISKVPREEYYSSPRLTQDYETSESFIREYFESNGEGYAPDFGQLIVSKKDNIVYYIETDE